MLSSENFQFVTSGELFTELKEHKVLIGIRHTLYTSHTSLLIQAAKGPLEIGITDSTRGEKVVASPYMLKLSQEDIESYGHLSQLAAKRMPDDLPIKEASERGYNFLRPLMDYDGFPFSEAADHKRCYNCDSAPEIVAKDLRLKSRTWK